MAVLRRVNFLSQSRVDLPDLRAIESAGSADWDQAIQGIITNTSQGYIVRGFEISMAGAIGAAASSLQLQVDPGALLHIAASQSGTVLMVPPGTPNQQLNSSINTNVTGAFVPNAFNYIGIDYTRYIDPTTDAQVYIWDPTTNTETSEIAPRAQILTFTISISTIPWSANQLPIAMVYTDAGNNVQSITDCRWMLYRLGTGGTNPNPFFTYPWTAQPEGRTENPSSSSSNSINPFEGGDKMLFSMKDWMNAIMTSFLEIKGTTYWYSQSSAGSISKLREDLGNTFSAGTGTITHGVLPNNDPVLTTTGSITTDSNQLTGLASTAGLVNGLYIFGTGIPYNTTIVSIAGSTVTMSNNATLTNATVTVSFYSPSVVTSPGQINWSDPFYLKVVGSALSYEIATNPTSTDIILSDDEVGYITLNRDVPVTPNLAYVYNSVPNTTTVSSVGSVSWTTGLLPGDFVRATADSDSLYTEIKSVDSLIQVTLYGNYVPAGQSSPLVGVQSVYAYGSYYASATPSGDPRAIQIVSRAQAPTGQNIWWLFSREDLGGVNPTVYVRFIGTELDYGDSNQIDDGIPKSLLQYMGSPSESVSKPQYVSAINPGSIAQITSITVGDATTVSSNQYFYIFSSGNSRSYYVWINKDGTGTDPMPESFFTPIEWVISTGYTSTQVAQSLVTALNGTFYDDFSAVNSTNIVTVVNNSSGTCNSSINFNVGTPFAISITQQGTGTGNYSMNDGDNLTVAIKKIDESISNFALSLEQPNYDETVSIVSSGGTPPTSINGPVAALTNVQLPLNSRLSNIQAYYSVNSGKLQILLNGQKLIVNKDYLEVGNSGTPSKYVQFNFALDVGDIIEFTFGSGGGGGSGGGSQGPPGVQGPAGPSGADALNGPINISTKTSSYNVLSTDGFLLANCSSGAITFTLPIASTVGSKVFYFKKIDSTSNGMYIQTSGGALIDGVNVQSTVVQYESFSLVCDSVNFWIF